MIFDFKNNSKNEKAQKISTNSVFTNNSLYSLKIGQLQNLIKNAQLTLLYLTLFLSPPALWQKAIEQQTSISITFLPVQIKSMWIFGKTCAFLCEPVFSRYSMSAENQARHKIELLHFRRNCRVQWRPFLIINSAPKTANIEEVE
jgi:hypothetical protein